MLGRGLVASPDLIARQKGGPALDKESLRTFHDQLYHGYCAAFGSERNAMLRMKEVWFYLIHRFRRRSASGPVNTSSPMWLTSKSPAAVRTAICSAITPVGYWTGSR